MQVLERRLANLPFDASDCREIVVDADELGATVTFTTRDTRTAERHITRPHELHALVEALLVTVPEPPHAEPVEPQTVTLQRGEEPIGDREVLPSPTIEGDPSTPLIAVGVGLTAGAGEVGSIGHVEVGYMTRGWELGLVGRLEPEHDGQRTTSHVNTSAIGGTAFLARRVAWGPVSVLAGGGIGVFSASEETKRSAGQSEGRHDELLEPRLGATFGLVAPPIGRVRLRSQLDAQLGLFSHRSPDAELPAFSHFTIALTIGAETGFLP